MRIQNNVPALNAHRYYGINQSNATKSMAKLSSGYRINSAADDAAGLAISEKMRAQIRGLTMASKNTQDAISLIQTAEGGMQEIDNMVQRIRELVVYASNDTQDQASESSTQGDRQKIQDEIDQLVKEIDSMANRVEFNKKKLINGAFAGGDVDTRNSLKTLAGLRNDAKSALNDFVTGTAWTDAVNAVRAVAASEDAAGTTTYSKDFEKYIGEFEDIISGFMSLTDPDLTGVTPSTGVLRAQLDDLLTNVNNLLSAAAFSTAASALSALIGTAGAANVYTAGSTALVAATQLAGKLENVHGTVREYDNLQRAIDLNPAPGLYFQIGANADQSLEMSIASVKTDMLGIGDGYGNSNIDVMKTTGKGITFQLDILDEALTYVTTQRSKLGAAQNRLEYTMNSLDISAENLTAAESRIRDVDMAKEMTNFTRQSILFQASTAMLAQANAFPQGVLQLLG
jgi:flagellin